MTLHASREGQDVTIHGNVGVEVSVKNSRVSYFKVTENAEHVRWFHTQLGMLLDAADAERNSGSKADTAYGA